MHCLDKNVIVNDVHCAGNIDIKKDENSNVSLIQKSIIWKVHGAPLLLVGLGIQKHYKIFVLSMFRSSRCVEHSGRMNKNVNKFYCVVDPSDYFQDILV